MMKVVGEEGTSLEDFVVHLKAEYLDAVYLQQDAYHAVDAATPAERQRRVFAVLARVLRAPLSFDDKDAARRFFLALTQATKDWNRVAMDGGEFAALQERLERMVAEASAHA